MNDNTHADTIRAAFDDDPRIGRVAIRLDAGEALDDLLAERDQARARADRAEAIVERFHEAWWNWNPGDDTESLDAAASEAMDLLGTVIRLNPAALSAGSGGQEMTP